MIGPLTSATLRVVPAAQHGIASAAVVVARMIGMLVGIAALSAWGLYRFNQILAEPAQRRRREQPGRAAGRRKRPASAMAYVMQYGEIFGITAIVCVVGALLGLLISGRHEHADEPVPAIDADDMTPDPADRRADAGDRPANAAGRAVTDPASAPQQRSTPGRISCGSSTLPASSAVRPRNRVADECLEALSDLRVEY